ncbi:MAG: hypothetical protein EP329_06010 [Deltaproteobacteria bacterium]|nr:MAG: hypothetical protein EP329_06010 [Deltaproteobacteria bacterium]
MRRALIGALGLFTLGLSGCPCDSGYPDLFYDGLQEVCSGVPCGWTVAAGDVASVATFHSGERGLQLAVGGDVSRALPELRVPGDGMISLLVDCDAQTTLVVEVDGASVVPAGTSDESVDVTLVARREPEPGEGLGGVIPRLDLPLTDPTIEGEPPTIDAVRLRVYVEGPGACVIDEIHIVSGTMVQCFG